MSRSTRRRYPKYCKPRGSEIEAGAYVNLHRPDHPLANKQGHVGVHRLVLFAKIGGLATICHWCGRTVDWWDRGPQKLVTDHLDGDGRNNEPDNLVASCTGCNSYRSHSDTVVERNIEKNVSGWWAEV